jgi:hydrogenase assembly chaperone HypC/HupF
MCINIPAKVLKIKNQKAMVKQKKHYHWVDISLVGEKIKIGDYLLLYQQVAIGKISSKQAKDILALTKEK